MLPVGSFGNRRSFLSCPRFVLAAETVEPQEVVRYMLRHFVKIGIVALYHDHAVLVFLLRRPNAEAGKRGGDGRYMEGAGLARRRYA